MKLYLLSLKNEKWLLHLSKSPSRAIVEAKLIYDFAKFNGPVEIKEEYEIESILEVDFHVKRNMLKYGIENVRGGSYDDLVLPEYLAKTLYKELSLNISFYEKNGKDITDMTTLYDTMLKQDPKLLEYEHNAILKKLAHFQNISYKWNTVHLIEMSYLEPASSPLSASILDEEDFTYYGNTNTDVEINATVFADIDWLKERIVQWKEMFETSLLEEDVLNRKKNGRNDVRRYDVLLKKWRTVIELYVKMKEMDEDTTVEMDYLLKNPMCVLNIFFYADEEANRIVVDNGMDIFIHGIVVYLKTFENHCDYVLNRKAEYQQDMNKYDTYETNFHTKLEFASEYITNILALA